MSDKNADGKQRGKRPLKDDLMEAAGHLRDLLIAPKLRGDVRDAEKDKYVEDAVRGASLKIQKKRKAA